MLKQKRKNELRTMVSDLKKSLPNPKPIDNGFLEKSFINNDYISIVKYMKQHMSVLFRISIKYYSEATPPAHGDKKGCTVPAQVSIPASLPPYGKMQENISIVLSLYGKSEAFRSFHSTIMAISHEFAHIVLHGINHRLQHSEEATDIAAILLGYSKYYESGHTSYVEEGWSKLSYLTFEEVIFVAELADGTYKDETIVGKAKNWFKNIIGT